MGVDMEYWFRIAVFSGLGTVGFESREWSASFASATPSIAFQALKSASLAEAFDKDQFGTLGWAWRLWIVSVRVEAIWGGHGTWDWWMPVVLVVGLSTASDTIFLMISLYNIVIES